MGGRGSGGRRIGSGQKPRGVVLPYVKPAAPLIDPPAEWQGAAAALERATADLAFLEQAVGPDDPNPQIAELETRVAELQTVTHALAVWHELAPHALEARTLTPGTVGAFTMLCRAVVLERALSASTSAGGANHRGLMHRVATWKKDFCLAPLGKPMVAAPATEKPVSKWAGALLK